MVNTINLDKFTGMNNVKDAEGLFVGKGVAQPRIILNADVTDQGRIVRRDGFTEIAALTDGHSLWSGSTCILVMDGTTLKRLDGDTLTTIEDLGGLSTTMYYAEVGDQVYFSNKYRNGIFDSEDNSVSDWGITLPTGPVLSSTSGSLDSGIYHVCFTQGSGDNISGNGPVSHITLSSTGGISIGNRPTGAVVWCTDPNGDIFYRIGEVDTIVNIPSVEPLPSLFCSPPPYLEHLTHAFGRMWGARGNILYYSEPFRVDWWKLGQCYFEFATDITLVAKTYTGLFVGCEDRTYSLLGTEPEKMQQTDVGAGAVPGTLVYCNDIIELGDTISPPEKKHRSVPVWVSETGIVAGNPVGRLFSLSQGKVRFNPGSYGASLYRNRDGNFQYLTSFYKGSEDSGLGMSDDATIEVVRNGRVI